MWQEVRAELHPKGLEIVTVALDSAGAEAARPFIERAHAEHPSLIDEHHVIDEKLGVFNVPNGVWIDEEGMIVRPAEPATPPRKGGRRDWKAPEGLPDYLRETLAEANKIRIDPERYVPALLDWVEHGAESRYALSADEVMAKSRPRSADMAAAAAHFELGLHVRAAGREDSAIGHFKEAHRLDPDNWTYKRQAWIFSSPVQGPIEGIDWPYEGDWLADIRKIGAENYYPPLQLDE